MNIKYINNLQRQKKKLSLERDKVENKKGQIDKKISSINIKINKEKLTSFQVGDYYYKDKAFYKIIGFNSDTSDFSAICIFISEDQVWIDKYTRYDFLFIGGFKKITKKKFDIAIKEASTKLEELTFE